MLLLHSCTQKSVSQWALLVLRLSVRSSFNPAGGTHLPHQRLRALTAAEQMGDRTAMPFVPSIKFEHLSRFFEVSRTVEHEVPLIGTVKSGGDKKLACNTVAAELDIASVLEDHLLRWRPCSLDDEQCTP